MWKSTLTRRQFTELIVSGRPFTADETSDDRFLHDLSIAPRSILVGWKNDPFLTSDLPVIAVLQDEEINDFFALVNSTTGGPSPLSAFCRILNHSQATLYAQVRRAEGTETVINALLGLSFSEAIAHAGGRIQISELTPAICKRTIAYAWAKALRNNVPLEQLEKLVEGWFEAMVLTSNSTRIDAMRATVRSEISMLKLAGQLYHGHTDENPIARLGQALVDNDRSELQRCWNELTLNWPRRFTIEDIASATREERGSYFQSGIDYLYSTDPGNEITPALCAFLATQISPSTFEHFNVLSFREDSRLALWYSFFAALQKPRGSLGFNGGLGSRLSRDVNLKESFAVGPSGDISLNELRVIARAGLEGVAKRLGHSNEIEVEIIPLVTCSFRFQLAQHRQPSLFEDSPEHTLAKPSLEPLTNSDKMLKIIELAQDLASAFNAIPAEKKAPPKRTRKKQQT